MATGTTETVEFVGAAGARLTGILHRPEGNARGSTLLAHCFTCGKDLNTITRLARGLVEAGDAVFRFDFTGLGESGGDFATTTVTTNVGDLTRAAVTLIEMGFGPCAMVGHSLGGAATLLAAHRLKTVRAVAVVGAPSDVGHVRSLLAGSEDDIRRDGRALVDIGGRPFPIGADFVHDLERHDVLAATADLGRPLLVVHSEADEIVPYNHGVAIHDAAREPKRLLTLSDADHLLSNRTDATTVADAIAGWFTDTR